MAPVLAVVWTLGGFPTLILVAKGERYAYRGARTSVWHLKMPAIGV